MTTVRSLVLSFTALLLLANLPLQAARLQLQFSPVPKDNVEARLKMFKGDNRQRAETLKQLFTDAGCADHLSEQKVKGSKSPNIVCTLPGSSAKAIIVGAHYDYVAEGSGVVDNWSGASLLPSLYEAMKGTPRTHTYIFVGFTDEEKGLVGSHFYVHEMTPEQVANSAAMVNMDTLGLGPPEVWYSHADRPLALDLFKVAAATDISVYPVDADQIGTTDSESFVDRKIPRITIHSLSQETWDAQILHTSKDQFSMIKMDDYYTTYRLVAVYLAYLDSVLDAPTQPEKH